MNCIILPPLCGFSTIRGAWGAPSPTSSMLLESSLYFPSSVDSLCDITTSFQISTSLSCVVFIICKYIFFSTIKRSCGKPLHFQLSYQSCRCTAHLVQSIFNTTGWLSCNILGEHTVIHMCSSRYNHQGAHKRHSSPRTNYKDVSKYKDVSIPRTIHPSSTGPLSYNILGAHTMIHLCSSSFHHQGDVTLPEPITRISPRISPFQEESKLATLEYYHTTSWGCTPPFNYVIPNSTTRGHTLNMTLPESITRISPFQEQSILASLGHYHITPWMSTSLFSYVVPNCTTRGGHETLSSQEQLQGHLHSQNSPSHHYWGIMIYLSSSTLFSKYSAQENRPIF